MKVLLSFQPFLSQGRHKASFNPKLSLLNKFACIKIGLDISHIAFTNPDRKCSATELSAEIKPPLSVKLAAQNHENRGRIYAGNLPSVTAILDATRPKSDLFALFNWKRKQILNLGKTGYEEKVANIRSYGMTFHKAINQYLSTGNEPELLEPNKGHWKSIEHVLSKIDHVIALESAVVHPQLQYAGTLDGLVYYQGKLCVIDWKTSGKKRTTLKDCFSYPHQIVAYAGAVNFDHNYSPIQVCSGLLVLAYSDGSPADTIWMQTDTCQHYWSEWLLRVELFRQLEQPGCSATSLHQKKGNSINDLAQYIGGVSVLAQLSNVASEPEPAAGYGNKVLEDGCCNTASSEWLETSIDILEEDPTLVEFKDSSECDNNNIDCEQTLQKDSNLH